MDFKIIPSSKTRPVSKVVLYLFHRTLSLKMNFEMNFPYGALYMLSSEDPDASWQLYNQSRGVESEPPFSNL